jgi:hypothetical protein
MIPKENIKSQIPELLWKIVGEYRHPFISSPTILRLQPIAVAIKKFEVY